MVAEGNHAVPHDSESVKITPMARNRPSQPHAARAARGALATAVGTGAFVWLAMGDISEPEGYMSMFRPPLIPRATEVLGAVLVCAALVFHFTRIRKIHDSAYNGMSAAAALIGMFLAFTLRVLSSLTVGANIGGGLLLLVAPFVLILLAVAVFRSWLRIARRPVDRPAGRLQDGSV